MRRQRLGGEAGGDAVARRVRERTGPAGDLADVHLVTVVPHQVDEVDNEGGATDDDERNFGDRTAPDDETVDFDQHWTLLGLDYCPIRHQPK